MSVEVSRLTDSELVMRLERLVQADQALSAKLLVHLGELDERKLFLGRGDSSTFEYCRSALRMSEAEDQAAPVGGMALAQATCDPSLHATR